MSGRLTDAIDDYARRITTDMCDAPPHVVFMVAVNGTDPPHLAACAKDGRVYDFAHMTTSTDESKDTARAAWTFDDLDDANHMLGDFVQAFRRSYKPLTPPAAVAEAAGRRARRHEKAMDDAMAKAAYIEEHPFVCVCGERWKSERGFKQHQRACRRVRPTSLVDGTDEVRT